MSTNLIRIVFQMAEKCEKKKKLFAIKVKSGLSCYTENISARSILPINSYAYQSTFNFE